MYRPIFVFVKLNLAVNRTFFNVAQEKRTILNSKKTKGGRVWASLSGKHYLKQKIANPCNINRSSSVDVLVRSGLFVNS